MTTVDNAFSAYSSDDSSSSDDEEYLTAGGDAGNSASTEDREAMIRRKLLESFYGTTVPLTNVPATSSSNGATIATPKQVENPSSLSPMASHKNLVATEVNITANILSNDKNAPQTNQETAMPDIDSSSFHSPHHTKSHILTCTSHDLLTTDESLALSIRLLDSTMQTLVYENYSKFIDATDAIRNIGHSVNVSQRGLNRLKSGIEKMETSILEMDATLRKSRESVAEKLRVKRLLTRLTRLLELPHTLKKLVDKDGKYRVAMKNYYDAMQILERHSDGFESLKSIEGDCVKIIGRMVDSLKRKIWVWCGGLTRGVGSRRSGLARNSSTASSFSVRSGVGSGVLDDFFANERFLSSCNNDFQRSRNTDYKGSEEEDRHEDDSLNIPPIHEILPPQSISEIFESTGALLLYYNSPPPLSPLPSLVGEERSTGVTERECKVIALECCTKYLEAMLEDHIIDIQEEKYRSAPRGEEKGVLKKDYVKDTFVETIDLVPSKFLDNILNAATLFRLSANWQLIETQICDKTVEEDIQLLNEYVSRWFSFFLEHVRMILLEHTSERECSPKTSSLKIGCSDDLTQDDEDDVTFAAVSNALTLLLRSVRELASGLTLPEVGLDMVVMSNLVEQTVGITEEMVRRRVAQKFSVLRAKVLSDCITPFAKDAIEKISADLSESTNVIEIIEMANVTLSDAMQLVDDMIRSILIRESAIGSTSDLGLLKAVVRKNARKFAFWLSVSLECVAGCDPSETCLEVQPMANKNEEGKDDATDLKSSIPPTVDIGMEDNMSVTSYEQKRNNGMKVSVEGKVLRDLCEYLQARASDSSYALLTLAMVEMCHLAERNVMDNMNQSIVSSTEEDTKAVMKGSELFSTTVKREQIKVDSDDVISYRFQVAASRMMALYASIRGTDAATEACKSVFETCSIQSEFFPHSPTDSARKILEVARQVSLECANAFGGEQMAGPIPDFSGGDGGGTSGDYLVGKAGAIKGLQLDVARMFTEKVHVYPHPTEVIDFSRNTAVTILFKISLKAWMEQARHCTFTSFSYRQMQVDVEFLRFMLPHYVKEESIESLNNLLNDLILNVGERCMDVECVAVTEYYDEGRDRVMTPTSIVLSYLMEENANSDGNDLQQFVIREAEEEY